MCRFTVYKGRSVPLGDILLVPDYSLIHQSRDASYHPGVIDKKCCRNIRVNGDGFGVGWYKDGGNSPEEGSCLFKLTSPAWSNRNLRNIGTYVCSPLIFGHVRAASAEFSLDHNVVISDDNCHPFKYGCYTFMHNGYIPNFFRAKRMFCMTLDEEIFSIIRGNTDSEHIFALFLSLLPNKDIQLSANILAETVNTTIVKLIEICTLSGITCPCSINIAVTDGVNIIATRFRNGSQDPPSLYYSFGSHYSAKVGNFLDFHPSRAAEVLISSAPLSRVELDDVSKDSYSCHSDSSSSSSSVQSDGDSTGNTALSHWTLVPKDHMLVCEGDASQLSRVSSIHLRPIITPVQCLSSSSSLTLPLTHSSNHSDSELSSVPDTSTHCPSPYHSTTTHRNNSSSTSCPFQNKNLLPPRPPATTGNAPMVGRCHSSNEALKCSQSNNRNIFQRMWWSRQKQASG